MARRGHNKALPQEIKLAKGTARPSRVSVPVVPVLEGEPIRPAWLKGRARTIWDQKVAIYAARQQMVRGCEGPLAQYCALEAELVKRWAKGIDIPMAMVNGHRLYANEFYDTSASQQQGAKKPEEANPFDQHGRSPYPRPA